MSSVGSFPQFIRAGRRFDGLRPPAEILAIDCYLRQMPVGWDLVSQHGAALFCVRTAGSFAAGL
jgi:hypothetical protein